MAYVEGYENDVFISYSRVDDVHPTDPDKGWVTVFEKHLQLALDRHVGRLGVVKIWRDKRDVLGGDLFDELIEKALDSSAVFVALTSRGFLESEYCRKELVQFHEKASAEKVGLAPQGRMRIVNVLLSNLERGRWPNEFGRAEGFVFHDAESDEGIGQPVEPEGPRSPFQRTLSSLSEALYQRFETIKTTLGSEPSETRRSRSKVYLADVPDTLRKTQRRLTEDLAGRGIEVISGVPPPYEEERHDDRLKEILGKVDVSVHLLDEIPGREIEGKDTETYPRRQVELATRFAKTPVIWMPREPPIDAIDDELHKKFLKELERGQCGPNSGTEAASPPYEFIRTGRSEITRVVVDKVEELRKSLSPSSKSDCLLTTHKKDTEHLLNVMKLLMDLGEQPYIDQEADEPSELLRLYDDRLKKVKRLIIFFGAVSREWVRERLDRAIRIAALEGVRVRLGVYIAPPSKSRDDLEFRGEPFTVHLLDNTRGFNPGSIRSFLEGDR